MEKLLEPQDRIVNDLYKKVEKIITENKNKMIYQINSTLVNTNFLIGKVIVENEQNGNIRAEYGKQILLKLSKIDASGSFKNYIEIECIEMNHYENPFKFGLSFYWDSSSLQTILLIKFSSKEKIIFILSKPNHQAKI